MSWNDYYRRRDVIDAVLRHARRDPDGPLPFDEIPGAADLFGTPENLLLAMHYRWQQTLGGRLRAEVGGPEDTAGVPGGGEQDHLDAVSRAWRRTVADNPTLRAVLDAHVDDHPDLRRAHEAELRMLALTAGVAEPGEPDEEITQAGNALVALMRARTAGGLTAPRRNPVGQLLRKLAPTG
ncbi:hypothetical protein [Prauserella rugosa]|uniref:TetR family transcriptional regulator n=1 Tax=Prauserella rugosa TaxID=43354 RepID=A0A660C450_9PSEU|nr:hypothetical protein [Prauserella rugosa]KMS88355.1 hypothetical protein ACZ91_26300 [Streptomyces regensis]TWH18282.1 hypothetical protein JD82_00098 [Prauserella rugosa]